MGLSKTMRVALWRIIIFNLSHQQKRSLLSYSGTMNIMTYLVISKAGLYIKISIRLDKNPAYGRIIDKLFELEPKAGRKPWLLFGKYFVRMKRLIMKKKAYGNSGNLSTPSL